MDEFRDIYERHYAAVYRLALFLTGDANHAEDCGIGPDAKGESQDDGDRETLGAEQGSQCKPKVGEQCHGASV